MNEVMFVTGGELLQFLPIPSKKRVVFSQLLSADNYLNFCPFHRKKESV